MATDVERGIKARCPSCGERDSMVVQLHDLGIRCTSCDAEWTTDQLREVIRTWAAVLDWIEAAPTLDD